MANSHERSNVVPLLTAALVCDVAVADPMSDKKCLIGIFDRIWVDRFPASRPLSIYWKFTDAIGRYEIRIRFVHSASSEVIGEGSRNVDVEDRLVSHDYFLPLDPIPFDHAGRYEFQVFMNDNFLGSTPVYVEQAKAAAPPEGSEG